MIFGIYEFCLHRRVNFHGLSRVDDVKLEAWRSKIVEGVVGTNKSPLTPRPSFWKKKTLFLGV